MFLGAYTFVDTVAHIGARQNVKCQICQIIEASMPSPQRRAAWGWRPSLEGSKWILGESGGRGESSSKLWLWNLLCRLLSVPRFYLPWLMTFQEDCQKWCFLVADHIWRNVRGLQMKSSHASLVLSTWRQSGVLSTDIFQTSTPYIIYKQYLTVL